MKKRFVFLLISLLLLNILAISIKAEESPPLPDLGLGEVNPDSGLPIELEKIQTIGGKFQNENDKTQYLKQEWGKILANNTYIGPVINRYNKISPYTDPIFKFFLGIEPSLSWLFLLSLTLWITIFMYIYRASEFLPVSDFTQIAISLGTIIIISLIGIIKKLAELIISAIAVFNTWWMQLIGAGIIIILFVLGSIFSKNLADLFKSNKEKKAKQEEELNREKLKAEVELAGKFTKTISDDNPNFVLGED
ncbi:MAG: hypothetical protein WC438_03550 [Candidatus Pacearchaeota archaeon]